MHGAERVVDEDVAEPRELAREVGVVRRVLRVEARVLQQQHVAVASGPDSVRFRPPLTVSRSEIDEAVAAVRTR